MNSIKNENFYQKRLKELNQIFEAFVSHSEIQNSEQICYRENAVDLTCQIYFEYLPYFKEYLENPEAKVNIFKIVSGTELAIIRAQPIIDDKEDKANELNAQLAFFSGLSMFNGWHRNELDMKDWNDLPFEEDITESVYAFIEEHLIWLQLLNPQSQYPYFSNSQTWRLYYTILALANW